MSLPDREACDADPSAVASGSLRLPRDGLGAPDRRGGAGSVESLDIRRRHRSEGGPLVDAVAVSVSGDGSRFVNPAVPCLRARGRLTKSTQPRCRLTGGVFREDERSGLHQRFALGQTLAHLDNRGRPPPTLTVRDGHDVRLIPCHLRRIRERGPGRRNPGEVKSPGSHVAASACLVSFALMAAGLLNIGRDAAKPGRLADSDLVCAPLDCFSYR